MSLLLLYRTNMIIRRVQTTVTRDFPIIFRSYRFERKNVIILSSSTPPPRIFSSRTSRRFLHYFYVYRVIYIFVGPARARARLI